MSNPYKENILRGAAWLDENVPGWRAQIDVDILNMNNYIYCIIGQLDIDENTPTETDEYALLSEKKELGFYADDCKILTDGWIQYLMMGAVA
jgi:hypothetical protein